MRYRLPAKKKQKSAAPAWIVTFADLATLLLTFFILLLSFAELDAAKYRVMVQSMAVAFGTQNVQADAIGGSPLTLIESDTVSVPKTPEPSFIDERSTADTTTHVPVGVIELTSRLIRELEPEVASEDLSISYDQEKVVIRFSEEATFRSGAADIKPRMVPIIERVVDVLGQCTGDVLVAGYTDDRPIVGGRYRSNWDLSAARAVSVVHHLVMSKALPAERVTAAGRAETSPLAPNDTAENRARNRRVEISIRNPECDSSHTAADNVVDITH